MIKSLPPVAEDTALLRSNRSAVTGAVRVKGRASALPVAFAVPAHPVAPKAINLPFAVAAAEPHGQRSSTGLSVKPCSTSVKDGFFSAVAKGVV